MHERSILAHAPDSNFLEYNNAVETGKLKVDNGILMEDKNEIMFNPRIENLERDKDLLPTEEQNGDGFRKLAALHDLVDVEDSINGIELVIGDSTNPFIDPPYDDKLSRKTENSTNPFIDPRYDEKLSHHTEDSTNPFINPPCDDKLFRRETELYTDKSVTECELPELIVCFKEGAYNVMKDICIDEGLPSVEKILIENGEVHDKGLFACFNSDMDANNELRKGMVHATAPVSDGTDLSIECQHETNSGDKCESEKGLGNFNARDETLNMVSNEVKLKFLVQECNNISPQEPCSIDGDEVQQQSDQVPHFDARDGSLNMVCTEKDKVENEFLVQECNSKSLLQPCNIDGEKGQRQSDQDACEAGPSTNSLALSVAEDESNNCNQASELPFNSEMESGTITLDFDSLPPPTTSSRYEDDPQKTNLQQTQQTLNRLLEEDFQDSKTASSRSFFIQHGHGESSFSSVGPLSGPIAYSGPIPYSGSISLRSDSSTTSTRSFAFPVLHSEWNSSPVKMVKADRRHLRKHRGWRLCFLCCRF